MSISVKEIGESLRDSDYPRQITLEVCAYCNLRCVMCPHPMMEREKGFMSEDIFRTCVDEIADVAPDTEVWLADHGESLIAGPALLDMIRYAKGRGLENVFLNSNGMLLERPLSVGLVEAGLDVLALGIDAYTADTYSRIRVGGDLDRVIRNVDGLLEEKRKRGSSTPAVWVQFIEMDENEGEREAFRRFWSTREVGIKVRRKLSWGACIDSPQVRAAQEERIACPWLINLMHVLWDGRVCRCSGDHECRYPMGSVAEKTIGDIWRGSLRHERRAHLEKRFDELNDQCTQCTDWKVGAADKYPLGRER